MSSNAAGSGLIHKYDGVDGNVNSGSGMQYNITINLPGGGTASRLSVGVPILPTHKLIGREELLHKLKQGLLAGGNQALTALNGLPGVGKTTTAAALARDEELLAHFSGGVLWAGLGQTPNLDEILNRWADALGVDLKPEPTTEGRVARLQAGLGGRSFLIVLDDVWHWEDAELLRRVTGNGCAHLLTTRIPTIAERFAPQAHNIIAELSDEQGAELLGSLCSATRTYIEKLRQLSHAVGGLPLALTLIGGYLVDNVSGSEEAAEAFAALEQAGEWLGLKDIEHPRPINEVIGLSVDELEDDARAAFIALAPFAAKPDSFSTKAAREVSGASARAIGRLQRRGLLERGDISGVDEERVTLHQAIAAVALQRAQAAGTLAEAQERHARYYLELMKSEPDNWQRTEREWPQTKQAWGWVSSRPAEESLALDYIYAARTFQERRGLWRENIVWDERGLEVARATESLKDEREMLNGIGRGYDHFGEKQQALAYYQQALPISRQVGDRSGEAQTLNNIGKVYSDLGEKQQALGYFQQVLPICQQIGDRFGEATTLNNIGGVYNDLGDHKQALGYFQQALSICQEIGNRYGEATTLNNIGGIYNALGDQRQELDYYQQALTIHQEIGNRSGEATTFNNIGGVYNALGDQRLALDYYQQALPICQQIGDRSTEATTLNNIGSAYLYLGDRQRAMQFLQQALPMLRQIGNRGMEGKVLYNMGLIYLVGGHRQQAQTHFEQALARGKYVQDPKLIRDAQTALGRLRNKPKSKRN